MTIVESLDAESISSERSAVLLRHWHWLIPADFRIVCVTKIGDAFLRDPHGSIWWLDVGAGSLALVAADDAAWQRSASHDQLIDEWSARNLVAAIEAAGIGAGPGHCYTYRVCPILSGAYEPSNFEVVSVEAHFDIWGPIHERLKDIPDGTSVMFQVKP